MHVDTSGNLPDEDGRHTLVSQAFMDAKEVDFNHLFGPEKNMQGFSSLVGQWLNMGILDLVCRPASHSMCNNSHSFSGYKSNTQINVTLPLYYRHNKVK